MLKSRIMVVEDEGVVAADIQNCLKALGYCVTGVAASAEQAERQAGDSQPDLVLMDIRLSGATDGIEAASRIRKQYGIPVVFLTAHADEPILERAKATAPFGYVLKPYNERELHTTIEIALCRHATETGILALLKEKEVLLKEFHQRTKDNLQLVSSLLSLQANLVQEQPFVKILRESRDRVRIMALLHDRLYQDGGHTKIDFKQHLHELVAMVFRSDNSKRHAVVPEIQVGPVMLDVEAAVPLSFILSEIVSECLKHEFHEGKEGRITIQFFQDNRGRFHLIVRDNSVGLPQDSTAADNSLGLRLVQILTDQMDGTLTHHCEGGTEFEVTFAGRNQNARN